MTNSPYPLVDRTITVWLTPENGPEQDVDITLSVAAVDIPIAVRLERDDVQREKTYRATIQALEGLPRRVMIDLYRSLVDGNYARFNKEGGHEAAIQAASQGYEDRGTLPGFENCNKKVNSAGAIVWNLLRHPEPEQIGYRVLGAILFALLDEEVLEDPVLIELPGEV